MAESVFDDLALDLAIGQALEALSVVEVGRKAPDWAVPYLSYLVEVLTSLSLLPPHVWTGVATVCRSHGYSYDEVVGAFRSLATSGVVPPGVAFRTLRTFLIEWRRQEKALRPPPRFSARP